MKILFWTSAAIAGMTLGTLLGMAIINRCAREDPYFCEERLAVVQPLVGLAETAARAAVALESELEEHQWLCRRAMEVCGP